MNIMLFSNGKTAQDSSLLGYGKPWIKEMLSEGTAKKFLFIPYAMVRGNKEQRAQELNVLFSQFNGQVVNIDTVDDPIRAIEETDGIIVSGGNTWLLNKMLHDLGLIGALRKAIIKENKIYIGWSAGTNIATPTIRTTNDMPIITSVVLPSLNLLPFQINPHYIEANISGHMGETRDERIEEYLALNQHEVVVGLPEGTMLRVTGDNLSYYSSNKIPFKLFQYQKEPRYLGVDEDIQFLMDIGC